MMNVGPLYVMCTRILVSISLLNAMTAHDLSIACVCVCVCVCVNCLIVCVCVCVCGEGRGGGGAVACVGVCVFLQMYGWLYKHMCICL